LLSPPYLVVPSIFSDVNGAGSARVKLLAIVELKLWPTSTQALGISTHYDHVLIRTTTSLLFDEYCGERVPTEGRGQVSETCLYHISISVGTLLPAEIWTTATNYGNQPP